MSIPPQQTPSQRPQSLAELLERNGKARTLADYHCGQLLLEVQYGFDNASFLEKPNDASQTLEVNTGDWLRPCKNALNAFMSGVEHDTIETVHCGDFVGPEGTDWVAHDFFIPITPHSLFQRRPMSSWEKSRIGEKQIEGNRPLDRLALFMSDAITLDAFLLDYPVHDRQGAKDKLTTAIERQELLMAENLPVDGGTKSYFSKSDASALLTEQGDSQSATDGDNDMGDNAHQHTRRRFNNNPLADELESKSAAGNPDQLTQDKDNNAKHATLNKKGIKAGRTRQTNLKKAVRQTLKILNNPTAQEVLVHWNRNIDAIDAIKEVNFKGRTVTYITETRRKEVTVKFQQVARHVSQILNEG